MHVAMPLKIDQNLSDDGCLSIYDALERLDDDDDAEDESDCEAEGISGYMLTTSWPAEKRWTTRKTKALMMPLLHCSLLVQVFISIADVIATLSS